MSNYLDEITPPLDEEKIPKVGIVLGGGGMKPFGCVYLFEMLEKYKIPIAALAATSGGSMFAGLYSMGYPCEEIKKIVSYEVKNHTFVMPDYRFMFKCFYQNNASYVNKGAIFKKENFLQLQKKYFGDAKLEDLQIPSIIATTEFKSGNAKYFRKGPLAEIVYASSALMPFYPPIEIDGKSYIDGGFSQGDSYAEITKMDLDIIIVVSFFDTTDQRNLNSFQTMNNFIMKSFHRFTSTQRFMNVTLHKHDTIMIPVHFEESIELWDKEFLSTIYSVNEKHIEKYLSFIIESYYKKLLQLNSKPTQK